MKQDDSEPTSNTEQEAQGETALPPQARKNKRRLEIHCDFSMPDEILGWERELLLPVVGDLLDDLLKESGDDE